MRFSVVIAVYNIAKFIESGIERLAHQTFKDFEVILVDDGSTDGVSHLLCQQVARKYDFIKLITTENQGVGPARNVGIESAAGDYICFYDLDDIIPDRWLESINKHLATEPELLVYSFREISEANRYVVECKFPDLLLANNGEIRDIFMEALSGQRFCNGFVWNKVYSRKFLTDNQLRFESLAIQQDEVFNVEVYKELTSMALTSEVLYDYYIYDSGNNRSRHIPNRMDIYLRVNEKLNELVRYWDIQDASYEKYLNLRLYNGMIVALTTNLLDTNCDLSSDEKTEQCRDILATPEVKSLIEYIAANNLMPRYFRYILVGDLKGLWRHYRRDKKMLILRQRIKKLIKRFDTKQLRLG